MDFQDAGLGRSNLKQKFTNLTSNLIQNDKAKHFFVRRGSGERGEGAD
ncbi:hypothetical protein [uncultured Campylobacter sp.]|nr:hypothetical protein [uncultured Campylobacter sp.]